MQGKWKRFGLFVVAIVAVIATVTLAAREQSLSNTEIAARVFLVGVLAYLLTFVVWPRDKRSEREAEADKAEPTTAEGRAVQRPQADQRPVAVIQPRPAGTRPGSRVHLREGPVERNPRGRRVDTRKTSSDNFRWPAQR